MKLTFVTRPLLTFAGRCRAELPWTRIFLAGLALLLLGQHWIAIGWLQGLAYLYLSGFTVYYIVKQLLPACAGSVQTLWYFFSLALFATVVIGLAARFGGFIDNKGVATGKVGSVILWLSSAALDIGGDFWLVFGIAVLIVLPQLLSYGLSGLCGCASTPRWLDSSVPVVLYGMAKSCIVAAGVLMPLAFFEYGWRQVPSLEAAVRLQALGVMLIVLAFISLWYLHIADELRARLGSLVASHHAAWLRSAHAWMTRNQRDATVPGSNQT